MIREQIEAVMQDIGSDAAKTGMLADAPSVRVVAGCLESWPDVPLVVDPVMVTTSGDRLADAHAVEAIRSDLIPLAAVVTPNRSEAEILADEEISTSAEAESAARAIYQLGAGSVLLKGGHLPGRQAVDYFFDGTHMERLELPWIETSNTHGSGCTLAAAIAAYLARGADLADAVKEAKQFVHRALQRAYKIGRGPGPLGHF